MACAGTTENVSTSFSVATGGSAPNVTVTSPYFATGAAGGAANGAASSDRSDFKEAMPWMKSDTNQPMKTPVGISQILCLRQKSRILNIAHPSLVFSLLNI